MGLASYGQPRFIGEFRDIIRTEKKGQFRLNLDYFRHAAEGVDMTWSDGSPKIGRIFSDEYVSKFGAAREPNSQLTDRESDLAASLQLRLEEVAFHILTNLHDETGLTDLGLSGGVAYNSVMNGKILLHTPFQRIFVQPAAGDSGTALGVCYQILSEQSAKGKGQRAKSKGRRAKGEGQRARGKGVRAKGEEGSAARLGPAANDASRFALGPSLFALTPLPLPLCSLPFTGPEFTDEEILEELQISDLKSEIADRTSQISDRTSRSSDAAFVKYSESEITTRAARDIVAGLVVGWFQGRM